MCIKCVKQTLLDHDIQARMYTNNTNILSRNQVMAHFTVIDRNQFSMISDNSEITNSIIALKSVISTTSIIDACTRHGSGVLGSWRRSGTGVVRCWWLKPGIGTVTTAACCRSSGSIRTMGRQRHATQGTGMRIRLGCGESSWATVTPIHGRHGIQVSRSSTGVTVSRDVWRWTQRQQRACVCAVLTGAVVACWCHRSSNKAWRVSTTVSICWRLTRSSMHSSRRIDAVGHDASGWHWSAAGCRECRGCWSRRLSWRSCTTADSRRWTDAFSRQLGPHAAQIREVWIAVPDSKTASTGNLS